MEVGRLVPTLHLHRRQRPGLDQLAHGPTGAVQRQAVVVAQVGFGGDAHDARRAQDQRPHRLVLGRRRQVDDRRRKGSFGQVIDPLEPAPRGGGDVAGPEQPFEGALALGPRPPARLAARARREIAAGDRAALLDLGEDVVDVVAPLATEPGQAGPGFAGLGPRHAPAEQRLHLQRHQRGLVTPVFEQGALLAPGLRLQHALRIVAQPREGRQIVGAGQDVDAVDLDHAQPLGDLAEVAPPRGGVPARLGEPLGGQGDTAGLFEGEVVGLLHGVIRPAPKLNPDPSELTQAPLTSTRVPSDLETRATGRRCWAFAWYPTYISSPVRTGPTSRSSSGNMAIAFSPT